MTRRIERTMGLNLTRQAKFEQGDALGGQQVCFDADADPFQRDVQSLKIF